MSKNHVGVVVSGGRVPDAAGRERQQGTAGVVCRAAIRGRSLPHRRQKVRPSCLRSRHLRA